MAFCNVNKYNHKWWKIMFNPVFSLLDLFLQLHIAVVSSVLILCVWMCVVMEKEDETWQETDFDRCKDTHTHTHTHTLTLTRQETTEQEGNDDTRNSFYPCWRVERVCDCVESVCVLDCSTIQFAVLWNHQLFSSSSFLWESGFGLAAVFPGKRSVRIILAAKFSVASSATLDLKMLGLGRGTLLCLQVIQFLHKQYYPKIYCFVLPDAA